MISKHRVHATYYLLILETDVTRAMINRSVHAGHMQVSALQDVTKTSNSTVYKLVEVEKDKIILTDIFDTYRWYGQKKLNQVIDPE